MLSQALWLITRPMSIPPSATVDNALVVVSNSAAAEEGSVAYSTVEFHSPATRIAPGAHGLHIP